VGRTFAVSRHPQRYSPYREEDRDRIGSQCEGAERAEASGAARRFRAPAGGVDARHNLLESTYTNKQMSQTHIPPKKEEQFGRETKTKGPSLLAS